MRGILLHSFFLFILLWNKETNAQTTLAAGDIAFIGYNCDDNTANGPTANDDICFVLLRNISAGTIIYFTDFGWRSDANAFQTANPCGASTGALSDGIIQWTAVTNMSYGAKVNIRSKNNLSANRGTVTGIQTISGGTDYVSLATGGDQIFAYQGSFASPTLLAGLSANGPWDATLTNCTLTSSGSILPSALASNNFAIEVSPEVDNARLKTSISLTGVAATDLAAIHNVSNWEVDDVNAFVLPPATGLPVTFTSISLSGSGVLKWGVAGEYDVEKYVVEQSFDGRNFSGLADIPASGAPSYSYTINNSLSGLYRIKVVDIDGKYRYSSIMKFSNADQAETINVHFKTGVLFLRFDNIQEGNYSIAILNSSGNFIWKTEVTNKGVSSIHQFRILSNLSRGIYFVRITGTNISATKKLMVNQD